jgi:leucine dehydrogenase
MYEEGQLYSRSNDRRAMTALAGETELLPGFEEVRKRRGDRSGLTVAIAIHRTVAGRALGGCRIHAYASAADAVRDAQRLARTMTLKAAVAGLELGGAKGVIATPPGTRLSDRRRRDAFHDFAELVDSLEGRYITAQDAGTSLSDVVYMARFTDHVSGHPIEEGGSGDPSPYTARGVEIAIRAALGREESLHGRHMVIVGLGHVGGDLARMLHEGGASLTVADVDERKRELADDLGAAWVTPAEALITEADVLAPCAMGGVLDSDAVSGLRVPLVLGAANNQLADPSVAELLRQRGIVWAPDFVVNAGGLIAVADELHGFDPVRVERGLNRIAETLSEIYSRAAAAGVNTLVAAEEIAAERLVRPIGP